MLTDAQLFDDDTVDRLVEQGAAERRRVARLFSRAGFGHGLLDKLEPSNVLSLCWDGALARKGPATFESTRENFAPRSDLNILVLQQAPR